MKIFHKLKGFQKQMIFGAMALGLMALALIARDVTPVNAQTELGRHIQSITGPQWIGPWYSHLITQRPTEFTITLAPDKLYIPTAERWFWPEFSDSFQGIGSIDVNGNQGRLRDVYELDAVTESDHSQVVGMIADFGNQRRAFDVLTISDLGWSGRLINNFDFYPKFITAGRAVAEQLNDKIFAYVYDSVNRVYLAYDLNNLVVSSNDGQDGDGLWSQAPRNRDEEYQKLLAIVQSDPKFTEQLQNYLKQNTDRTQQISVKKLLEDKILVQDELLKVMSDVDMDLVVSDENGTLIPNIYGEAPALYASWNQQPRELKMDVLPPNQPNNQRAQVMLYTRIIDRDGQQKIISTQCQFAPVLTGSNAPDCRGSSNFYFFRFPGTSFVSITQPSSVPGWSRVGAIERLPSGQSNVVVAKFDVWSNPNIFYDRQITTYSTQSTVTSAAILSLSPTEYFLVMVENEELKIFFVNDSTDVPQLTDYPIPVSTARNFKDVAIRREGDAMILNATTMDNQLWEFKAAVPGTLWRP